nr:hypothetical protein CFP56_40906 [Quercus suber]
MAPGCSTRSRRENLPQQSSIRAHYRAYFPVEILRWLVIGVRNLPQQSSIPAQHRARILVEILLPKFLLM